MDSINHIIHLLENNRQEEALKEYQFILQQGSNDERLLLGEEFFQYGFLDEAKALFEKLLEEYPEEGELLVALAEILVEQGDEDEALQVLNKISEHDVSFPQSLLLQADIYLMEGLFEVCESKLLQAKDMLPEEVIIDFALGELYLEQGRFIEAIKSYEKVIVVDEIIANVNIHQRLGDALSAGGAFEEALPHYESALKDSTEINTLFQYAFTAFQAGIHKLAIEKFSELKEMDPEYHSLYLYLAKSYEKEEEIEKGFLSVLEGLRVDEYNKELFFYGGKLALKLGNEEESERLLRQSLVLDSEFIEAGLTLNKLLLHQERYEDVLEIVGLYAESELEEPQLLWDEALALQGVEKYSEALNKYQQAYNYLNEEIDFLSDYGYFLLEEGIVTKAAEIFTILRRKDPTNGEYEELLLRLTED